MGKLTGKAYRPSNGTEGMYFTDKYCMNCIQGDPNPEGKKQCEILLATLIYNVNEKGYPPEWQYNDDDEPVCTNWKKWDWGNDGDPDDPDNPNYRPPDDPNQLCFPFLFDEIGINEVEKKDSELPICL